MIMEGQNKNGNPFDEKDWANFKKDINKSRKINFTSPKILLTLLITVTIIYLLI